MALNVSAYSIRRPLPAIVLSMIFMFLGAMSLRVLPITRLPNVDVPIIAVAIGEFGAAPAELNGQVTKLIEDAVSGVEGVRHIMSSVTDGLSVTTVQFQLDSNTDRALNDVKDAVTRVRSSLPRTIADPLIQRIDVVGLPIVTYAAVAPGKTPEQLSWFVDDVVKRALQGVKGVGQVGRIGGVDREVLVALDPDKLQSVHMTAADVSRRLRGTAVDVAGGRAELGGNDQAIRTLAAATTVAGVSGTMLTLPTGGQVRLDDLGTVTDTIAEPQTFARLDGKPVVGFNIMRAKSASDVTTAAAVADKIKEVQAAHPDIELRLIDTSTVYTYGNYESAIDTLFEGAMLAVFLIYVFFRDFRATLITAVTLPLSIMPAFWAMDILGFSLNLVSLLAITLSTGILVDDSIVEIENIERHIQMGKKPYQASLEAADEIGHAVIAISLTIIAIFIPASFMGSVAGQFFKQFGITVSVQVFFSLLAARFVTPVLAAYFLRPRPHLHKPPGLVMRGYSRALAWSIRRHFLTVAIGVLLFVASLYSTRLLPSGFLPAQDTGRSLLAIELPSGSPLTATDSTTEQVATRLHRHHEVRSVFVDGGRIPPATMDVRKASLIINYVAKDERTLSQRQLEQAISRDLEDIPDIRFWFVDENGMRDVELVVTGPDSETVSSVSSRLVSEMHGLPAIDNIVSSATLDRPELRVRPRADFAARVGISTEGLSEMIRVATIGDVEPALAKLSAGERQIPIRVQLDDRLRADKQMLEQLRLPLPDGHGAVPLGSVAEITLEQGPSNITRYDRERQAKVSADLVANAVIGQALDAITKLPVMRSLPPGVRISQSGDAESMNELSDGFASVMREGLAIVYALLVLLFGSFLQPITILFSLPLSVGGAILGLLITGKPLSMPVIIGILMLMGIVTKNSIMLVDFVITSIKHGVPREIAALEAGQKRARPIIMTTIAMAAGMLPSALAFGAGGEFRAPMAIAVIGGLLTSTVLSLVFVPALFLVMDDLSALVKRGTRRLFAGGPGTPLKTAPEIRRAAE